MPSTATQRKLVSQFVAATNSTRENAQRYLKNANYDIDVAANLYFSSADAGRAQGDNVETKLNKIFDDFLDEEARGSNAPTMGIESFEKYLQHLDVDFASYELFVVLYITRASSMAELTRRGFVEGWTDAYQTEHVRPDLASQKAHVRSCIDRVSREPEFFKKVYRHAFVTGKEESQKALDKEMALAFWDSLLGAQGAHPWRTRDVDWLAVWKEFLGHKWTRSVNKDMWNQTLVFADKTLLDESLGFWSEMDSWPGVIDDFVEWCKETGVVKKVGGPAVDGMEVDD